MAHIDNTIFSFNCQQFRSEVINIFDERRIVRFTSNQTAGDILCPLCDGPVIGHGQKSVKLKDIPLVPGEPVVFEVLLHRYLCMKCRHTFIENNPLRAPNLNITCRCVLWIYTMLKMKISTSVIAEFLGLSWNTVRKVENIRIDDVLTIHEQQRLKDDYRPFYLAVDEFAIRKGHRYATSVMDLVTGDVLWVGKGRSIKDFDAFLIHSPILITYNK